MSAGLPGLPTGDQAIVMAEADCGPKSIGAATIVAQRMMNEAKMRFTRQAVTLKNQETKQPRNKVVGRVGAFRSGFFI